VACFPQIPNDHCLKTGIQPHIIIYKLGYIYNQADNYVLLAI